MIEILHSGPDPEGISKLYKKAAQTPMSYTFVVLMPIPQFTYKICPLYDSLENVVTS